MSTWSKVLTGVSIATGVLGAAALGGVTAQRVAIRRFRVPGEADQSGYGALEADRTYAVAAPDGVILHVEEVGAKDAPLTVIFSHGWTLRSGSWHFQRLGLAGPGFGDAGNDPPADPAADTARLVFFDQRSHGKSGRADPAHSTMADLAGDLAAVLEACAPVGPIVLVGHSMGGMATLAFAGSHPDLVSGRVAGVALISSSASEFTTAQVTRVLLGGNSPLFKVASFAANHYPQWIERGRAGSRDAVWLLTRTLGFARPDVAGELVDYVDEMISATPVDVMLDFAPALMAQDQTAALSVLAGLPVAVICGDADRQTPVSRSMFIAQKLPAAELLIIPGAGHLAILEAPDVVNAALRRLFVRALERASKNRQAPVPIPSSSSGGQARIEG